MTESAVLCLDLATVTGYALATPEALSGWPTLPAMTRRSEPIAGVVHGVVDMRSLTPLALRLCRFYRWFHGQVEGGEVGHVYFEASLPAGRQSSIQAGRIALGLAGIVQAVAWDHGIALTDVTNNSVKKALTGRGDAPKTAAALRERNRKRAAKGLRPWTGPTVEDAVLALGFRPVDDNAGDAIALLNYAALERLGRAPPP